MSEVEQINRNTTENYQVKNFYDEVPDAGVVIIKPSTVSGALKETADDYVKQVAGTSVRTTLPEQITIGLSNQVGQTWDFWKVAKNPAWISSTFGYNANKGIAERQFWQEIEPKDVTMELNFNSFYDAFLDVWTPSQQLLKYTAASDVDQSALELTWRRPVYIDVIIGNIAYYRSCIIKNCDVNYSNKLDHNGYPIASTVSLTFITRDPLGFDWVRFNNGTNGQHEDQMIATANKIGKAAKEIFDLIKQGYSNIADLSRQYGVPQKFVQMISDLAGNSKID